MPLRNKTIFYLAWIIALVHVMNSRISRRSNPRHPKIVVTLAYIDLSVINIHITPSLVIVSEKK